MPELMTPEKHRELLEILRKACEAQYADISRASANPRAIANAMKQAAEWVLYELDDVSNIVSDTSHGGVVYAPGRGPLDAPAASHRCVAPAAGEERGG